MNAHQDLIIKALEHMKGDDTIQYRRKFQGLNAEQMQRKYGGSGLTRAEILRNCEENDAKIDAAIVWVSFLPQSVEASFKPNAETAQAMVDEIVAEAIRTEAENHLYTLRQFGF